MHMGILYLRKCEAARLRYFFIVYVALSIGIFKTWFANINLNDAHSISSDDAPLK